MEGKSGKESLQLEERFCFLMVQLSVRNTTAGLRGFKTEFQLPLQTLFFYLKHSASCAR